MPPKSQSLEACTSKATKCGQETLRCSVAALDHNLFFIQNSRVQCVRELMIATAVKKYLGHICQYEKGQTQRPGTTFSNLSDTAVAVLAGHQNCCRFAALCSEST